MADPATAAGLALAVIPLIISALENYEYTFQPIIIFSKRYRKEVEKFQKALKVQKVNFANECTFLLHSVTSNRAHSMIDDLEHPLWRDSDLESRLRERLSDSYDGCVSSLSLINDILEEILQDTKALEILLQKVRFFSFRPHIVKPTWPDGNSNSARCTATELLTSGPKGNKMRLRGCCWNKGKILQTM